MAQNYPEGYYISADSTDYSTASQQDDNGTQEDLSNIENEPHGANQHRVHVLPQGVPSDHSSYPPNMAVNSGAPSVASYQDARYNRTMLPPGQGHFVDPRLGHSAHTTPGMTPNHPIPGSAGSNVAHPPFSRAEGSSSQSNPQQLELSGYSRQSALHLERLRRAADSRYTQVATRIINIMGDAQSPESQDQTMGPSMSEQLDTLNAYLASLSPDMQSWVYRYRPTITSVNNQERAKDKRKTGGGGRLFCCLWCNNTFTMKHNLANHVRSHLDLHISFCQNCEFSSVCSSLPTRHQCAK
ncbi:hypothetical protein CVT24_003079 [Panaeolus cyanescens]|uniref:C2H2-type domain-containing protein n=1 Tax=Panaeolus cyanescens TaxID=181874 RepID=A0A409VU65_9AGAR|nr:hypothetical protein CVT24_003079 [Panaeolus cyanescens]